jgi:hypothetical protein
MKMLPDIIIILMKEQTLAFPFTSGDHGGHDLLVV